MATTVFRVEKTENYTIISNYHLQDKKLSNKAKGLLTIMLSLPKNWDMTLKGLTSLSSDGIDAIRTTLSELEENGYLSRTRSRNSQGQLQCTEYTIREQPCAEYIKNDAPQSTPSQENSKADATKENASDNEKSQIEKSDVAHTENPYTVQIGKSDMDQVGKSNVVQIGKSNIGKSYIGKSNSINNLSNKDTYSINNSLSNQYPLNSKDNIDKIDEESKAKALISKRKEYEAILKENIEYDILTDCEDDEYKSFVDLALSVMLDAVTTNKPLLTVKGQEFPAETVKSRMLQITDQQIEYVWFCVKESNKKINKMQNYILTALYNSTFGENLYFAQRVKEDMQRR